MSLVRVSMSRLAEATPAPPEDGSAGGGGSPRRRAIAGAVALLVALAGFGLALVAFRGGEGPTVATTVENGRIAFASFEESDWQIFTVNPDGTDITKLTDLSTNQFHPASSPDGARIAFDVQGEDGRTEIDVMGADGSNLEPLTEDSDWNYLPAWSPDGTQLAFVSNRDGNDEIYLMNADGSGQTRLTSDPEEDLSPAWSPDGTTIAFQSNRDANNEIYLMNTDGSAVTNLTDSPTSGEFGPAWSPDGTRIAFSSDRDGNPEIYVMNTGGTGLTRLTVDPSHDWSPAWSPDGSRIAFESDRDGPVGVYVMNSDGTGVSKLTDTSEEACCPAWQLVPGAAGTPSAESTPTPSETSPPSIDPDPSARLQIAPPPASASSLQYAFGSVWVAWFDGSGAQITRIDAATNELVATIPIEDSPGWVSGGGGIAEGFGSIWVTGASRQGGVLQQIDPSTNRVVSAIQLGKDFYGLAADVAVADNGVWVASMPLEEGTSFLYRVDPETDQVIAEIPVEYEYERHVIAVNETNIVGQEHWHDDRSGPYRIFTAIDATTGDVLATTPEDAFTGMWAAGGQLWGLTWSDARGSALTRVDPLTLSPVGDPVPCKAQRLGSFKAEEGNIWFVTAAGVNHWEPPVKVNRFNTLTGTIDVSDEVLEAGGQDMAIGGDSVWFLKDGDVLRFRLSP
jgi:Tol biopolymer transport system component